MAEATADGPMVDYMSANVEVPYSDGILDTYENIDGWEIDGQENLRIRRRSVEVAVYGRGKWNKISLMYRLTDGSTISTDGDTGPPTEVGMGVTATAIGGRTS